MIEIFHRWGAGYLVANEPFQPAAVTLSSPQGITLRPGQRVQQIGRKSRSSFSLVAPHHMNYEGLLKLQGITYAIFNCPAHDQPQLTLFQPPTQYRYAFACVFVKKQFQCFLVGRGGPAGMRDIQLDYVA